MRGRSWRTKRWILFGQRICRLFLGRPSRRLVRWFVDVVQEELYDMDIIPVRAW
jgi:hypothetical protein